MPGRALTYAAKSMDRFAMVRSLVYGLAIIGALIGGIKYLDCVTTVIGVVILIELLITATYHPCTSGRKAE